MIMIIIIIILIIIITIMIMIIIKPLKKLAFLLYNNCIPFAFSTFTL